MRVKKRAVGSTVRKKLANHRERDRQIGSGFDRKMQIRLTGERRAPRIDHHEPRAIFLCRLDVRDDVNARRRRIAAPDHDQLGVFVIGIADAGHLSVHRRRGGARWRGA